MKTPLLYSLCLCLFLFASCDNDDPETDVVIYEAEDENVERIAAPPLPNDVDLPWITVVDTESNAFILTKNPRWDNPTIDVESMIRWVNKHSKFTVIFERIERDTLFVSLENAELVTNQSGTAGATTQFAELTYSLTELQGINYVDYSFEAGSHASPGVRSRSDFVDYMKVMPDLYAR